jgi:hypothetical protein
MTTTPIPDTAPAEPVPLSAAQASAAHELTYGWLARLLRRWLGIAHQRREFNQLGEVLTLRDQTMQANTAELGKHDGWIRTLVDQLNRTTGIATGVQSKLGFYEARVPQMRTAQKLYDQAVEREKKRRETLIRDHPEWSPAEQHHVRVTGKLSEGVAVMPTDLPADVQAAIEAITKGGPAQEGG